MVRHQGISVAFDVCVSVVPVCEDEACRRIRGKGGKATSTKLGILVHGHRCCLAFTTVVSAGCGPQFGCIFPPNPFLCRSCTPFLHKGKFHVRMFPSFGRWRILTSEVSGMEREWVRRLFA